MISTLPSTITKLNGGRSSSTQRAARRSRKRLRPLTVRLPRVEAQRAIVVDVIPDGSHVRPPVSPHRGQLSRARRQRSQKDMDLLVRHRVVRHTCSFRLTT